MSLLVSQEALDLGANLRRGVQGFNLLDTAVAAGKCLVIATVAVGERREYRRNYEVVKRALATLPEEDVWSSEEIGRRIMRSIEDEERTAEPPDDDSPRF